MKFFNVRVKDQFGKYYDIQAKLEEAVSDINTVKNKIKHIIIDGEKLKPGLEMLFHNEETGKIYKIVELP
ncbi:hypothetical protein ACG9Y7_11105 [Acinetobacter gerneri]|uniref:hypothetical protein n=1 Tax=Acinetobacter gerneri TaxID=202952 RepID=UPI003AF8013A